MMRQAERAERALQRMQADRRKLHADPEATDAAARVEHVTMVMLAEALARLPEARVPPQPAPARAIARKPAKLPDAASGISKTDSRDRKHRIETPPRRPERPPSAARLAMIDQALFGRHEPDPNRRYPGENGAQLLMRRRQQNSDPSFGTNT